MQVTFRVLEDRRAVMIAHKSARGSLKVQNGGRRAIDVLAVPFANPTAPAIDAPGTAADAASDPASSRQSSQSSGLHAVASMQLYSGRASSRPSSRDLSPIMRHASASQRQAPPSSCGVAAPPSAAGGAEPRDGDDGAAAAAENAAGSHSALVVSSPRAAELAAAAAASASSTQPSTAGKAPDEGRIKVAPLRYGAAEGAKRVRGSVVRLLKKGKRLPAGSALGVLRSVTNENWARPKQGAEAAPAVHPATAALREKGLSLPQLSPRDVLFWTADLANKEHRDALQRNDELEYAVVQRSLDAGDEEAFDFAVDIELVRAHRPATAAPKWQPPVGPVAPRLSSGNGRRVNKFSGSATVVVPGPEKGAAGFQAGRGRSIEGLKHKVNSFRLEDVVSASEFVPRSAATLSGGRNSIEAPVTAHAGQFDDAEA